MRKSRDQGRKPERSTGRPASGGGRWERSKASDDEREEEDIALYSGQCWRTSGDDIVARKQNLHPGSSWNSRNLS
ncbi:hypothetical protein ColLi_06820 [Colletotrichum liriopes]|uniref:Uncharacterized protein n=1 Tax=Colletotrichum liriopes TaxID=708192 RepID=A0AA37LTL3_9PEZI|nr:hypothetical protein ColLi_06820 [Colletotrichum liriopes]